MRTTGLVKRTWTLKTDRPKYKLVSSLYIPHGIYMAGYIAICLPFLEIKKGLPRNSNILLWYCGDEKKQYVK